MDTSTEYLLDKLFMLQSHAYEKFPAVRRMTYAESEFVCRIA